jgi:hypothetical protein
MNPTTPPETHSVAKGTDDAGVTGRATFTNADAPATVTPAPPPARRADAAPQPTAADQPGDGHPDVLLDVPSLSVDEIQLEVDSLRVHVALDARLANMLLLTAGAEAGAGQVKLTLKGVKAQAALRVKLDTLSHILERTLDTIDRNPQLLTGLRRPADRSAGAAAAGPALDQAERRPGLGLIGETVNVLGQTVQRVVDRHGNIIERTVSPEGQLVRRRRAGSLTELEVLSETNTDEGQVVRRLRDTTGAILELVLEPDAHAARLHVVHPAPS